MEDVFLNRLNRRRGVLAAMSIILIMGLLIHTYAFYFSETGETIFPGFGSARSEPTPETPIQINNAHELMHHLWRPFIHDINETTFVTKDGKTFEIGNDSYRWTQPLGKKLLILDVDSRLDQGPGAMMNKSTLSPKEMTGRTGGMMNHYLYAMIHGYDYRFIRAPTYSNRHGTWVKVPMIKEALKTHDFVVFLDADAGFMNLHLPFEWLMSMWNITDKTLIALANDPDSPKNRDEKGKVMQNTGFIIAQQSGRTQELFENWEACPTEKRYEGCKHWDRDWAHEQAAFANYVRYDYNSTEEVKAIPCGDGNGAPYIGDKTCGGTFVRHHWFKKDLPAKDLQGIMLDTLVERLHYQFHADKKANYLDASKKSYPLSGLHV
ncbi:hypothetical protein NM208_g10003 [Fusarium decemcellulare]|uniref:Uncharacterized protein n=1 Tax=Fusarium decemcellulare TaxID=57161 RepID=A0ACC1RZH7_9HYPO|nr:hypothetical protein NM208_g10003 [Fusarium decemcellulare]